MATQIQVLSISTILRYEAALKYFKSNSFDKNLPLTKWRAERDELTSQKVAINKIYVSLKDEIATIEHIRKNICEIIYPEIQDATHSTETRNSLRKKSHSMEI